MKILNKTLIYALMGSVSLLFIAPILIVLFTSFKSNEELLLNRPFALPDSFLYLSNYAYFFQVGNVGTAFGNSLVLIAVSVVGNILLGSMVAYVLGRFRFKAKPLILFVYMIALIVPGITTEVARFSLVNQLGVYDTLLAPTLLYVGTDIIQIYMFLQFSRTLPYSLDEAAMIEGASYFKIYYRIFLPLLAPATATVAILKIIGVFNDMYIPYLYMPSAHLRTVATLLIGFTGDRMVLWNYMSAGILVITVPSVLIYLIFQRWIFSGIAMGAVK
ncbi:carbohydrate ABC transporter permease [Cohnella sp. GbtcB17]|uniref:carbohydrate ABC transporter permease n=1 Tax=Cohnella sp. GbtcB17 TaxID=2824762 RepID=UPI001C2F44E1|nr:carbohydrate ABC transporter permease [Cohnella sp. GbtcB17]